ncbi:hypothetical protein [Ralstonia phage phiRSL1]|uniref:Uncharacterized protein n=1 Tax=Ralstonia phage phiRSL1 TaxID=1980924 RepID=B2ZY19_9CAUD|nr:hypothetical protein RSL1_ORF117 [Ralstonia phage phiRSL1]BAG41562.1 hypothetical protein [Ralstonia phage phiRSL1]
MKKATDLFQTRDRVVGRRGANGTEQPQDQPYDSMQVDDELPIGMSRGNQSDHSVNDVVQPTIPVTGAIRRLQTTAASKYPPLRQPLPKEPPTYNIVGYHATPIDNWASIKAKGLAIGKSSPAAQDWVGKWSGKAVYFHLQFPSHELANGYDPDTGEPYTITIETKLHHGAEYFVPDEDAATNVDETPDVIRHKGSIAVGYPTPPGDFIRVHLVDTLAARAWAKANVKRWPVTFHKV